jgi:RHS repeat-associated protein
LFHINDEIAANVDDADIDDMGTFDADVEDINLNNNYSYDEEGRLVRDNQEGISKIVWRVDGKVKEIQRATGDAKWLKFDYDAMGNRIAKHVYNNTGTAHERSTYYVLDAQGNQISTYDHEVVSENAQFNLKERNIFGSSRLGSKQDSLNVLTATLSQNITQILGLKYYEFSNHLGNVLTVYSDVKIPLDADANSVVDGYGVPIRNIADYSPFGVQLDGRTIQGDFYRRGFNGMEKDDEVKGGGNSYDFGARMYDARVGRWLSVDPKSRHYPDLNPYNFVANSPLLFIDPTGEILRIYYELKNSETGKTTLTYVDFNGVRAISENGVDYKMGYNQFVDDVINSYNYIVKNGSDTQDVLSTIATTNIITNVKFSKLIDGTEYDTESKTIFYNPLSGCYIENNENTGNQSPSLGFLHEAGHRFIELCFPKEDRDYLNKIGKSGYIKEENFVVNEFETPAVKELNKNGNNEAYRTSYGFGSQEIYNKSPTSTEKIDKNDAKKELKNRNVTIDEKNP